MILQISIRVFFLIFSSFLKLEFYIEMQFTCFQEYQIIKLKKTKEHTTYSYLQRSHFPFLFVSFVCFHS